MSKLLLEHFGVNYSEDLCQATLRLNGWTYKQVELIANEQNADQRSTFRQLMRPLALGGTISPEMLRFGDESHMRVGQARRKYGWSLKGEPGFR